MSCATRHDWTIYSGNRSATLLYHTSLGPICISIPCQKLLKWQYSTIMTSRSNGYTSLRIKFSIFLELSTYWAWICFECPISRRAVTKWLSTMINSGLVMTQWNMHSINFEMSPPPPPPPRLVLCRHFLRPNFSNVPSWLQDMFTFVRLLPRVTIKWGNGSRSSIPTHVIFFDLWCLFWQ